MVRILVCEHDFLDRSAMLRVLSAFGECDAATSAEECLAAFAAALRGDHPYDLVTLDPHLITTDGKILVECLRLLEADRDVLTRSRVLMTRSHPQGLADLGALEALYDGRIHKPADFGEVQKRLRAMGLSS